MCTYWQGCHAMQARHSAPAPKGLQALSPAKVHTQVGSPVSATHPKALDRWQHNGGHPAAAVDGTCGPGECPCLGSKPVYTQAGSPAPIPTTSTTKEMIIRAAITLHRSVVHRSQGMDYYILWLTCT